MKRRANGWNDVRGKGYFIAVLVAFVGTFLGHTIYMAIIAKSPGETHCYGDVCHRVYALDETRRMVGRSVDLVATHYDVPGVDKFNVGQYTSSGEEFDAENPARVSASNYPDGTELLLWHPVNQLAVHVRVNDFGPFMANRTIDVTRKVAENMGWARSGVAKLKATVIWVPADNDARYKRGRVYPGSLGLIGIIDEAQYARLAETLIETAAARNGLSPGPTKPDLVAILTPRRTPAQAAVVSSAADAERAQAIGRAVDRQIAQLPPIVLAQAPVIEIERVTAVAAAVNAPGDRLGLRELDAAAARIIAGTQAPTLPRDVADVLVAPRQAIVVAEAPVVRAAPPRAVVAAAVVVTEPVLPEITYPAAAPQFDAGDRPVVASGNQGSRIVVADARDTVATRGVEEAPRAAVEAGLARSAANANAKVDSADILDDSGREAGTELPNRSNVGGDTVNAGEPAREQASERSLASAASEAGPSRPVEARGSAEQQVVSVAFARVQSVLRPWFHQWSVLGIGIILMLSTLWGVSSRGRSGRSVAVAAVERQPSANEAAAYDADEALAAAKLAAAKAEVRARLAYEEDVLRNGAAADDVVLAREDLARELALREFERDQENIMRARADAAAAAHEAAQRELAALEDERARRVRELELARQRALLEQLGHGPALSPAVAVAAPPTLTPRVAAGRSQANDEEMAKFRGLTDRRLVAAIVGLPAAQAYWGNTIIAAMSLDGTVKSGTALRVDGKVDGAVTAPVVLVSEGAVVTGVLAAETIIVFGKVQGIVSGRNIYVAGSGEIDGELFYQTISIDPQAHCDVSFTRLALEADPIELGSAAYAARAA